MKMVKVAFVLSICSLLYAESLESLNLEYEKSRIKKKAESSTSSDSVCYQYVEISSKAEWDIRKDELNTYIQNNKNNCKKYIIYKEVRNVNTKMDFSRNKNNKEEYTFNIGVILEENPDMDITIYTQVKNSTLKKSGSSEEKANIGSVVLENNEDVDIEDTKITTVVNIENSEVGNVDVFEESGLNDTENFLEEDKDDPFND